MNLLLFATKNLVTWDPIHCTANCTRRRNKHTRILEATMEIPSISRFIVVGCWDHFLRRSDSAQHKTLTFLNAHLQRQLPLISLAMAYHCLSLSLLKFIIVFTFKCGKNTTATSESYGLSEFVAKILQFKMLISHLIRNLHTKIVVITINISILFNTSELKYWMKASKLILGSMWRGRTRYNKPPF